MACKRESYISKGDRKHYHLPRLPSVNSEIQPFGWRTSLMSDDEGAFVADARRSLGCGAAGTPWRRQTIVYNHQDSW